MTTQIFIYKITKEYEYKLIHYHGPKNNFLIPKITVDSKNKSITFDLHTHIFEINVHADLFIRIDIREDAIGFLVNTDSEHLDFTDVNEKTYTGLFLPDIANDIQYYNEEEFVVIDYGKAIFAIKEAVITYYTSPLNPDLGIGEEHQDQEQIAGLVTKYYFYRVFNNPGINQGALLIQKGEQGFDHNSFTMFLNKMTLLDIKDKKLLHYVLNQDPEYVEITKSLKDQTKKLMESVEFKQLTSFMKDQYEQFLKENKENDFENDYDLEEESDQYCQEEEKNSHQNDTNQENIDLTGFDDDSIEKYRVRE